MQNDVVLFAAWSGLEYSVTLERYFILPVPVVVYMLGTFYIVYVQVHVHVQYTGPVLTH